MAHGGKIKMPGIPVGDMAMTGTSDLQHAHDPWRTDARCKMLK
jgi:hypothetical protein